MANEKDWNKNFNLFDEKHYKHFKMAKGSRKPVLNQASTLGFKEMRQ